MDRSRVAAFKQAVYAEHLEEASFLYEQRGMLFNDPEMTWPDLDPFEKRFEAHLDALTVGGQAALAVCRTQAGEGDAGELHAAVRVFCRLDQPELVKQTIAGVDSDDGEQVKAIRNALNQEMPSAWQPMMVAWLTENPGRGMAVLPKVLGYHRVDAAGELVQMLAHVDERFLYTVLWALGRMRDAASRPALLPYLKHPDPVYCADAALALLRMGEPHSVRESLPGISEPACLMLPIGLGGQRSYLPMLLAMAEQGSVSEDGIIAMGLIGDIAAVAPLLALLESDAKAEAAALALNFILGADLQESAFIPEEADEDERSDSEAPASGEPLTDRGKAPGVTIDRLCHGADPWRDWWRQHQTSFRPEVCYRSGQPYSPLILLDTLRNPKAARMVRQMAYEEMVIRYGLDTPFETDMPVERQRAAFQHFEKSIALRQKEFRPGHWYFAGRLRA